MKKAPTQRQERAGVAPACRSPRSGPPDDVSGPDETSRGHSSPRERIIAAALNLFVECGIDGVSLDSVVEGAGVAKGTLYRHFPGRSNLVHAVFEPLRERVSADFERFESECLAAETPEALLCAYRRQASALTATLVAMPQRVLLYLQEVGGPAFGARVEMREAKSNIGTMLMRIASHEHALGLRRNRPSELAAHSIVGGAERYVAAVLESGGPIDHAAVTDELYVTMIEGLPEVRLQGCE